MIKQLGIAAGLALALVAATPAAAQQVTEGWRVTATPYLFAAAFDNDVKNSANGHTSGSDASFFDILENLSFAFFGKAEIQNGRFGVMGDLNYLKVKVDRTTDRRVLGVVETDATIENTALTGLAYYRVVETNDLNVDLMGGARLIKLKLDFDVQAGGRGVSGDGSGDITKGLAAVRATQRIGPKTSLTGYGDFGGFSGDTTTWLLEGTFNYQYSPTITAFAGYRHFVLDIDKGPVSIDVSYSGPVLGTTFLF